MFLYFTNYHDYVVDTTVLNSDLFFAKKYHDSLISEPCIPLNNDTDNYLGDIKPQVFLTSDKI